jgi:hypothetical protein
MTNRDLRRTHARNRHLEKYCLCTRHVCGIIHQGQLGRCIFDVFEDDMNSNLEVGNVLYCTSRQRCKVFDRGFGYQGMKNADRSVPPETILRHHRRTNLSRPHRVPRPSTAPTIPLLTTPAPASTSTTTARTDPATSHPSRIPACKYR